MSGPLEAASMGNPYPELDAASVSSLNRKLVDIVSLLHGGALSDLQLRELAACIRVQTANAETLHRFVLRNADEPAFAVRATWAADHEQ